MGIELRIAFAMGGGVSLGAYSGAALTEALKRLIVESGQPESPYDNVVVDVFSGSSAGTMALVLFFRALASPDTLRLDAFGDPAERLEAQFGTAWSVLDKEHKETLVAAQHAQDLQEQAWVLEPEVSLHRLLGIDSGKDMRHEAGLLDRGAVETIARRWLEPKGTPEYAGRKILARRVLFAATLSRLTPILADARTEFQPLPGDSPETAGPVSAFKQLGLVDGLTSKVYRDLRIFDLNFGALTPEDKAQMPERWMRFQVGSSSQAPTWPAGGQNADLRHAKSWATLAATAIASGAFPIAFSPVVLNRFAFEFGPFWPESLGDRYPFTYIDGGTFNNEPIREAFRLASHLDARRNADQPARQYARRVIFVDPLVNDPEIDYRLGVFQQNFLEKPNLFGSVDGYDLRRRTTLDRLLPQTGTIVSAIFNEARVSEGDKVLTTRKKFTRRRKLHRALRGALRPEPSARALRNLEEFCEEQLQRNRLDGSIPAGALDLESEIGRVLGRGPVPLLEDLAAPPTSDSEKTIQHGPGGDGILTSPPLHAPDDERLGALIEVALDLVMGLEGKSENASVVGIAPFDLGFGPDPNGAGQRYELPAEGIQGFAGFASLPARRHAAELGKFCAWETLFSCGLWSQDQVGRPAFPTFSEEARGQFREDLRAGLQAINRRLEQVIETSHLINLFSGADRLLLQILSSVITGQTEKLLADSPRMTTYEVHIEVPDDSFRLRDPGGVRSQNPGPTKDANGLQLVSFIDWSQTAKSWSGIHVDAGTLRVRRRRFSSGDGPREIRLELPTRAQRRDADLMAYPIFRQRLGRFPEDQPAARWILDNPQVPLESSIFGSAP